MKDIFDYIYYRLYTAYFRWDSKRGTTAICGVSMIQVIIPADIFFLISYPFSDDYQMRIYGKYITYSLAGVFFILTLINERRYKGQIEKLRARWDSEDPKQRFLKGALVLGALTLPWIFFLVLLYLKKQG